MHLKNEHIINAIIKNINNSQNIKKHFDFSYKSQKHELKDLLNEIIKIIKYALPWREIDKFSYNTVYSVYKTLIKFKILKSTYIDLLKLYLKKCPNKKLKYQYTDTTCIPNKYGSDLVKYNGYKKKKCTKVSLVTDSYGIPINVSVNNGSECDSKIIMKHFFNSSLIDHKLNSKHKKFLLADSIYDIREFKDKLLNNRYVSIISPNIKNTKNKILLKFKKLSKSEIKIYKKRIKIEHTNNKLKCCRRLNCRYDRNVDTFYGSIWLTLIDMILKTNN